MVEVSNNNLDQVLIDMDNCWRKLERDKEAEKSMEMQETYTQVEN